MGTKHERKERRLAWLESRLSGRVLDIGCSDSLLGERALGRGCDYVGVDIDADAIERTRASLQAAVPDRPFELVHSDFDAFEDAAGFDTVVLAEVLEHQSDPGAFLAKARGLLRDGGALLATTPFSWMPDPTHLHAPFAGDHLRWLAAAGLRAEELEVSDYHCRVRALPGEGCAVPMDALLEATEREAEKIVRFWVAERDRQTGRVETLIAKTEAQARELDELRRRLRAARQLNPVEQAKRIIRSVRSRVES